MGGGTQFCAHKFNIQPPLFFGRGPAVPHDVIGQDGEFSEHGDFSHGPLHRPVKGRVRFTVMRMPCGQTEANAVFFRIGAVAYNIYRLFLLKALDVGWHKRQVQTVRWRLYQTAGEIVEHAKRVYLKVRRGLYRLFEKIRLRIWEFVNT
jgi:hypothetical protein